MNEIHDNLAPITPVFFTVFDWIIIAIILVIIVLIVWQLLANNKKKHSTSIQKPKKKVFVPKVFSFEKELNHIEHLKQQSQWKDFALQATALLKKVLENEYKMQFDFATGREVQEIMSKKNISSHKKQELKYFFNLIDPIKFAHAQGKEEIAKEVINILKDYNNYFKK